jgi:drug/metabolite transporter (DMT)-like permease
VELGLFRRQGRDRRLSAADLPRRPLSRRRRADDGACRRQRHPLDAVAARRRGLRRARHRQPGDLSRHRRLALGTDQLGGIGLAVLALFSLVGGTILFKFYAPKQGLWIGNGVQSLAAGVAVLPFALGFESFQDIVPTMSLLLAFAYNVLLVSIFAYLLWFRILQVSGATAASSYHFLIPPLGMLFGWLILGEHLETADLFGIVPVALGIWLVTRPAAARA